MAEKSKKFRQLKPVTRARIKKLGRVPSTKVGGAVPENVKLGEFKTKEARRRDISKNVRGKISNTKNISTTKTQEQTPTTITNITKTQEQTPSNVTIDEGKIENIIQNAINKIFSGGNFQAPSEIKQFLGLQKQIQQKGQMISAKGLVSDATTDIFSGNVFTGANAPSISGKLPRITTQGFGTLPSATPGLQGLANIFSNVNASNLDIAGQKRFAGIEGAFGVAQAGLSNIQAQKMHHLNKLVFEDGRLKLSSEEKQPLEAETAQKLSREQDLVKRRQRELDIKRQSFEIEVNTAITERQQFNQEQEIKASKLASLTGTQFDSNSITNRMIFQEKGQQAIDNLRAKLALGKAEIAGLADNIETDYSNKVREIDNELNKALKEAYDETVNKLLELTGKEGEIRGNLQKDIADITTQYMEDFKDLNNEATKNSIILFKEMEKLNTFDKWQVDKTTGDWVGLNTTTGETTKIPRVFTPKPRGRKGGTEIPISLTEVEMAELNPFLKENGTLNEEALKDVSAPTENRIRKLYRGFLSMQFQERDRQLQEADRQKEIIRKLARESSARKEDFPTFIQLLQNSPEKFNLTEDEVFNLVNDIFTSKKSESIAEIKPQIEFPKVNLHL